MSNSNSSSKRLLLIGIALMVLMFSSIACNDVKPGDGQVGNAVMSGYDGIRDTASELKDAVDATGEGLEFETHESPLPALWDWAEEIAQ